MTLGNHVKRRRFERDDMSQEDLAQAVGVTRQTIIAIEKARFVPSTLLALRLARFFQCRVEDIFFIVEQEADQT